GVGGYVDARAPSYRPHLKTGAVVREAVAPILIEEPYRDQKLGSGGGPIVHLADFRKIELVPMVRALRFHGIPVVEIVDAVAEGVDRAGQLPGEYVMGLEGIGVADDSRVGPVWSCIVRFRRSIEADQPVLTAHLPIIVVGIAMMQDAGEETFGPG